jgi:hypothetical protein
VKTYHDTTEILMDHELASLGDTYVNFVYSLALSKRERRPVGKKVKGSFLAEALKNSGLRENLPSRMNRHRMADAAEALIVYAWLNEYITLKESVAMLEKANTPVEGFTLLLEKINRKVMRS